MPTPTAGDWRLRFDIQLTALEVRLHKLKRRVQQATRAEKRAADAHTTRLAVNSRAKHPTTVYPRKWHRPKC